MARRRLHRRDDGPQGRDLRLIYTSEDSEAVFNLLHQYQVRYVFVGALEKRDFGPNAFPMRANFRRALRKRRRRGLRDPEMSGAGPSSAAETPFSDFEKKAWIALLALSTLLHLVQLGTHALHHDESIHAWAALHLLQDGTYKYDPVYHGPVQYYAVALASSRSRAS